MKAIAMKKDYRVIKIQKSEAAPLLKKYHYLSKISKGFKVGHNYGLAYGGIDMGNDLRFGYEVVGACIFSELPVPELSESMFGLSRKDQEGLFELSRLVIHPTCQKQEHNIASWFVARAINLLRKHTFCRAILSYADSEFHEGTVYAASNFSYCGMSDPKSDFFFLAEDGSFVKHSRGKIGRAPGEWRERSRKHRFVKIFDPSLNLKWPIMPYKKKSIAPCPTETR